MEIYRRKALASLCLLLAVGAAASFFLLLRPDPAEAATNRQRQFVFGPVGVASGQTVALTCLNSGARPTPPAQFALRRLFDSTPFYTQLFTSTAPGAGTGSSNAIGTGAIVVGFLTFGSPVAGQSIPNPLPATIYILEAGKVQTVLGPARR